MLAERLNELALDIHRHGQTHSILEKFENLISRVEQAEQNPQGTAQDHVLKTFKVLANSLESPVVSEFTSSELAILEAIGGRNLVGPGLRDQIQAILDQSAIETETASDQLRDVHEDVESFYENLRQLKEAFDGLGVERSTLPKGDAVELGAIFPFQMGDTRLSEVSEELQNLEDNLRWMAEVGGDYPGKTRVRAVGSSGFEVFLESPLGLAAAFAIAIEGCERIIQRGLDIVQKYQALRDAGAPEEISDERIEEAAQRVVDREIEDLVEELVDRHTGDEGRENEIRQGLEGEIRYF